MAKRLQVRHITHGSVLDDLGLSANEALELKIKADLWRDLLRYIEPRKLTQRELARLLEVHQPDISNLLSGKLSHFSIDTLVQFAVRLNLQVQVKLAPTRRRLPRNAPAADAARTATHAA